MIRIEQDRTYPFFSHKNLGSVFFVIYFRFSRMVLEKITLRVVKKSEQIKVSRPLPKTRVKDPLSF